MVSPSTAKFLATYIINLVLVLHRIFADVLLQSSDPPRVLTNEHVVTALARHNADLTKQALNDSNFATDPEQVIDSVIKKLLRD